MMVGNKLHLFIQIPCLNEAETLAGVMSELPESIHGISKISVLVIDDGSTDDTVEVAKKCGANFIVQHPENRGLANGFSSGLEYCFKLGADIVVNTDGDNQYRGEEIKYLVQPILEKKADMVIGSRDIKNIDEFSFAKKMLQKLGSYVISVTAGMPIVDATSGFRALNKRVGTSFFINRKFTYTLETIIQAARRNYQICSVPISVNSSQRKSRLSKSMMNYVTRSFFDILSIAPSYNPMKFFAYIGIAAIFLGTLIGTRFVVIYLASNGVFETGSGYVQSLILAAIFILFGSFSILIGFLAEQVARNRSMLEEIILQNRLEQIKKFKSENDDGLLIYKKDKV